MTPLPSTGRTYLTDDERNRVQHSTREEEEEKEERRIRCREKGPQSRRRNSGSPRPPQRGSRHSKRANQRRQQGRMKARHESEP